MNAVEPEREASRTDGTFELTFRDRAVYLTVRRSAEGGRAVTADDVLDALQGLPPLDLRGTQVQALTRTATGETAPIGRVSLPPGTQEAWFLAISVDGLAAHAVPVAAEDALETLQDDEGGDPAPAEDARSETPSPTGASDVSDAPDASDVPDAADVSTAPVISAQMLRDALRSAGVTVGLQEEAVSRFDPPQPLSEICCLAEGKAPTLGRNGEVSIVFDEDPRLVLSHRDDGSVDFHASSAVRFVEAGTVLATWRAAVPGEAGVDVRGQEIPPAPVEEPTLESVAGMHTVVEGDTLVAEAPGRPQRTKGRIEVVETFEVKADLDYAVGSVEFSGDVVVQGDVKPGFNIKAGGSVVVHGVTESASIEAVGNISVGGVVGETTLKTDGDLTARYLHHTEVIAAGRVTVKGEIINCEVTAAWIATSPTGRIIGGHLNAQNGVSAGMLGSHEGVATEVVVRPDDAETTPVVRARQAVHPGVMVTVGYAILQVTSEMPGASFWSADNEVVTLGPGADEAELARRRESDAA